MFCLHCGIETTNPKFCSSKCSTIYNNRNKPKRKLKTILCKSCANPIDRKNTNDRRTYCDTCKPSISATETIQDVIHGKKHARSTYNTIRSRARKIYAQSDRPKKCVICGYDKHYQVCHLNSIASFPKDTLITVVNHIDNLVALCPNHHWEVDNGLYWMLDLDPIDLK